MKRYLISGLLLIGLLLGGVLTLPVQAGSSGPFMLNLNISLEWVPGSDDSLPADLLESGCAPLASESYLADLQLGLERFAAYFYRYSEGRLALGTINVYAGGQNWQDADIRILANGASTYRPAAFVGGIVGAPTRYISATEGVSTTFMPGTIYLGRLWSGLGSRCGAWSQPAGWRTIGHEWGHYALYLYDGYMHQDTRHERYCSNTGDASEGLDITRILAGSPVISQTASLMAYHYRADRLTRMDDGPTRDSCRDTAQDRFHGVPEWQTIKRFYPTISAPGPIVDDGVDGSTAPPPTINLPAISVSDTSAKVELEPLARPTLLGQSYLVRRGNDHRFPQRIIGQGDLLGKGDRLPFWGVFMPPSGRDRAAVLVQDWRTGQRRYSPSDVSEVFTPISELNVLASNVISPALSTWRPSVRVRPILERRQIGDELQVTGLRLDVTDCALNTKNIIVSYCPAGGVCQMVALLSSGVGSTFSHTFTFPYDASYEPPAKYGYIHITTNDPAEPAEETISWYQLAGGVGPAHVWGFAPLADATALVEPDPSEPRVDNYGDMLLFGPAQSCAASFNLPTGIVDIVGTPLDLQPVILGAGGTRGWGGTPNDPRLLVRLHYSQDLLDRLGIAESRLVLLRLGPPNKWELVPEAGRSTALDWIAGEAETFVGAGRIYAFGYREPAAWLPLVGK